MTPKPAPPDQIKALPTSIGIPEGWVNSTTPPPSMISLLGEFLRRLVGK